MSLLFRRSGNLSALLDAQRTRTGSSRSGLAGSGSALTVSAVWASLRLRADLISTMPLKTYRLIEGRAVEVTTPPVLETPAARMLLDEWLYATQYDLDRYGNCFGQVVARDGWDRPAQIELSDAVEWSVRSVDGVVEYRRRGKAVPTVDVWHERQYPMAGYAIGQSAIAAAARTIDHNLAAQEFAVAWFNSGAAPTGTLRNSKRTITADAASEVKARFAAAMAERGVFVTGNDWEYTPAAAAASDAKFLDSIRTTTVDVARFFGVPGDLIDAENTSTSITYANVVQRNLQLLTMHLDPALRRRERRFTADLLPRPWFARFNRDALLSMDPAEKIATLGASIDSRIRTPNEARAILDLPPFTDSDHAEFDRLFPQRSTTEPKTGAS